ncbi:TPA: long-chain fatty acid--CoA ligase [Candidatus Geothermarchaeota archaeon]|nr:long-chain fatty acid--CoA ligase [Candidatus Geothermarchaeota archaeon]
MTSETPQDRDVFEEWILSKPWLKNYDEGTPHEIEIPEHPLYKILDDSFNLAPDHTALIFLGRKISYRELHNASEKFGYILQKRFGVEKGDRVALYLPNTPQFVISYYGALKAGAVVTPASPLYTGEELARQLNSSDAKILVAIDLFTDNVEKAFKDSNVEKVIYTGIDDYLPGLKAFIYRTFMKKVKPKIDGEERFQFMKLLSEADGEVDRPDIKPKEDLATLMFTGGTTGVPKGAMLTHYNLVANIYQIDAWLFRGRKKQDIFVGLLPWFHIYGQTAVMNFSIFSTGTTIVLPRLDIKELLKSIQKYKANVFHGVPTLYAYLNNYPEIKKYNLRSIEACISGAAPLPVSVAERFEEITGGKLREGYGLTETSPVTHVNPIYGKYKFGSIGLPVPNTLAGIADPDKDVFLPPGEVGEVVVSGPQVMKGYYNMDEENKMVFFEKYGYRWFRTGDMGKMDEEGYFYIVDRKKDLIKYKGYSVYPREVEEVLYRHEAVKEAAVIGIPHKEYGELVKAYIVLKDEYKGKVSEEDIIEYAKEHLAPYKTPKVVEFRDDLPKSAVGKVLRRVLREEELKKTT